MTAEHLEDGLGPGRRRLPDGHAVIGGQHFAGLHLPLDPGRPEGDAGDRTHLVDRPDARLEAPASEVQPQHRVVAHPDPGALPQEAQARLLLAAQQRDPVTQDPLEPVEQPPSVAGVPQCGRGHRHHHVGTGVVGRHPQSADRPYRCRRPVGGDVPRPGHLGAQVEERTPAQHRIQPAVAGGVHHHQVERIAAQVEYGYSHGGHRRDAIPYGGVGGTPPVRWPTL